MATPSEMLRKDDITDATPPPQIAPFSADNPLFAQARRGKRLPHLVVAIVLGLVFPIVGGLLGGLLFVVLAQAGLLPASMAGSSSSVASAAMMVVQLVLFSGATIPVVALWVWLVERRPFWTLGFTAPSFVMRYLRGFAWGILLFAVSVGLAAALGYMAVEQGPPQLQGASALAGVGIVLLGWVVQGASEEVLARGWLLPVLGARYRPWLGIALSSLLFSLLHVLNPSFNLVPALNIALFGLFAALYALREGSLWGVCGLHTSWNWAQGNVFGLEVSGNQLAGGTLFNLLEVGPDLVTGGAFGPEGGLIVTLVLAAGCAALLARNQRL